MKNLLQGIDDKEKNLEKLYLIKDLGLSF